MIGVPLAIFYYIYLVFVLGFLLFTAFNVFHLLRFGFMTLSSAIITVVYLGGSIAILILSWTFISPIDWQLFVPLSIQPMLSL